ncbi:hypothetical protein C7H62_1567 [Mesoflavibacter sp. HG96]|uniref:hypothetical protein n=1 Tax=unclassified Mesoflavibacter TaxID=2630131 RepID=UPI000D0ED1FD|nr:MULTISPECIES: hypothetical protein [unclassified Mesoflavibacter]QIJ89376.1 hypothetical protein C7H62_1567 [Mesoflavibacter sp. HG96]QIJ92104.1 hypothetical protein C7H56_1567 [Mesoflavibacter sp. HG37]
MTEEFLRYVDRANVHFDIIHRLGSLLLMYRTTNSKMQEFQDGIKWYDENDNHRANKDRMKEAVRMLNGYRQNINELTIIGIAKSIEDLIFDFEDILNQKIHFWNDCERYDYFTQMKIIRNLNNCIKHSKGLIKKGHPSNDYLIDEAGFEENSKIEDLNLDLETYIYQNFSFQMDVFWANDERENPYKNIKENHPKIREILIPSFIGK